MSSCPSLPVCSILPIARFSALFGNRTNSYKFLFFFGILDVLSQLDFSPERDVPLDQIIVEMLLKAWYPHFVFRLSFGPLDLVAEHLDDARRAAGANVFMELTNSLERQREFLRANCATTRPQRYVPTRLLRPFFAREHFEGVRDAGVDDRLRELARERFDFDMPLYFLREGSDSRLKEVEEFGASTRVCASAQMIFLWTSICRGRLSRMTSFGISFQCVLGPTPQSRTACQATAGRSGA